MALPKQKTVVRPESEPKLSEFATKLLRKADAEGLLPTPLERLFEVAKVTNISQLPDESFVRTLSDRAKGIWKSAKQKLRGVADLREKATYIPRDSNARRERFVQGHELGHQVIPWHNIDSAYLDDSESLSADAKATFEQEANFFSSEIIFQGANFRTLARDYQTSFDAVFTLADQHGASRQATVWRFVEEQDEAVALIQYYHSNAIDECGNSVLSLWRTVGSPSFQRRFSDVDLPRALRTGHAWVAARDLNRVCDGTETLTVDDNDIPFQWYAWWNGRALLVLLRRKPRLSLVGNIIRPAG